MSWRIAARSVTPWTPAQISTALWLDAADSGTITTVGGAVSQWNDKSGNGRNATQATAASRPAYTLNAMNALPVITFNGSNSMLFSGVHDANWSAALVGRSNGIGQAFFQFGAINTQGSLFNDGNYTARPASAGGATIAWPGAENVLIAATFQATGVNIWRNGVAGTSSSITSGVAANSTSMLGALNSSIYLLNGFISELVVPNFGLSTLNRQQLEGYLAHKWGLIANLPNDHPYKVNPPYV